jgi:peptide-methionine (S)-S-oxide reductase
MTTYTLAGGCFWCLDAVFRHLKGVSASVCGYAGSSARDADYYRVMSGTTGHAEYVQVTFDESVIGRDVMLDIFFLIHDPTTLNRQGNDIGPQYRSTMFYNDDKQKLAYQAALERAKKHWGDAIVTDITPLEKFYKAEPEHADYFANNPTNPYCSIVIEPKITKARRAYASYFKED